jgi:phage FluMu protein Com
MYQPEGSELAIEDFAATADWYLTVRCSNPTCGRLIAFQKTRFQGGNPDLRLAVTGKLSVDCPHCKMLVRFQREQIERRNVVLTQ